MNKVKSCLKTIRFAVATSYKYSKMYVFVVAASNLLDALVPFVNIFGLKFILSELTDGKNYRQAIIYAVIMFMANLILKSACILLRWIESVKMARVLNRVYETYGKKFMSIDYQCLENPDELNKFYKANRAQYVVTSTLPTVFKITANVLALVGNVAIIMSLDAFIVLPLIICVIVIAIVNAKATKKAREIDTFIDPLKRFGDYLSHITTDYVTGKEIRIFLAQSFFTKKLISNAAESMKHEKSKILTFRNADYASILVNAVQAGGLYVYSIYKLYIGAINISQFSMYMSSASNFASSITNILESVIQLANNSGLLDGYYEFLQMSEDLRNTAVENAIPPNEGFCLEFKNVWFKYPNQVEYALEDISFKMEAGETVSIVGRNGAGKTTLIKLVCRLYDPDKGEILVNGTNIKKFKYDEYMGCIATVFQDYQIFAFTAKDNITFGKDCKTDEINDALKKFDILNKIESLPDGLDSHLKKGKGWEAVELSGGEYQKIAITRAYLKYSPFIILDEPTASIDPIAEYNIYKNFNEIAVGKNVIYISHRMSSVKFSDKVMFIEGKRISGYDTHDAIIASNPSYAELYNAQAQYYV